jgi:hypothetical protein
MGGLFSTRLRPLPDVQIDLESAEPCSDQERSVVSHFREAVLQASPAILERFAAYRDAQGAAAAAISNPSDATKAAAWEAVCPNVELQMEVFDFSHALARQFRELLRAALERVSPEFDASAFASVPGLARAIAQSLDLIFTLDELKLAAPKLINDLAYFRRNANAFNTAGQFDRLLERSNETTVFWAAPAPVLALAVQWLAKDYPPAEEAHVKALGLLGGIADLGTAILAHHPEGSDARNKLCLRCIVGGTLMYDQTAAAGAFAPPHSFHVKQGMRLLVAFQPKPVALINAIKYGSKHLSEQQSDPEIRALFA